MKTRFTVTYGTTFATQADKDGRQVISFEFYILNFAFGWISAVVNTRSFNRLVESIVFYFGYALLELTESHHVMPLFTGV